jgi:glycosyltransferase involved in cell wall biosynthesis
MHLGAASVSTRQSSGQPSPLPRLRVIVLPNTPWLPAMASWRPGEAPDPNRFNRLMAERGIDFEVIDPLPPPWNPWGRKHPFFAGLDPARALLVMSGRRSADLVIPVFESGAVALLMLRRLCRFRAPVALWDVGEDSQWRPRRLALNYVLPRIDRLLTLTAHQQAATERRYRLRAPAECIGYSIDEQFYHPLPAAPGAYVLSIGEDVSRDYSTLVTALADLPTAVVLKTRRPVDIPPTAAASFRLMPERLSFLQLRALYAAAGIVAISLRDTEHPGGITTLFEAMAMGKPIVASDLPLTRELLAHGQTALLVPPGDAAALRDSVAFLLGRPDEQRRLGENARAALDAHFTMAHFADRFAQVIRKILA